VFVHLNAPLQTSQDRGDRQPRAQGIPGCGIAWERRQRKLQPHARQKRRRKIELTSREAKRRSKVQLCAPEVRRKNGIATAEWRALSFSELLLSLALQVIIQMSLTSNILNIAGLIKRTQTNPKTPFTMQSGKQ